MWKNINFQKCLAYIDRQAAVESYMASHSGTEATGGEAIKPSITISRMSGAGGKTVASKLVEYLQPHAPHGRYWTVFDKNLIEKVLEDHHLSLKIAKFLPEDRKSRYDDWIEEIIGLHPATAGMVKQTSETIWNLAANGYVILMGRGASVVANKLDNVFNVRLIGSLERRIARTEEVYGMSKEAARRFVNAEDTARRNYMKQYFHKDIEDPLLYEMIINTDKVSYEDAARQIADAVINRFKHPTKAEIRGG